MKQELFIVLENDNIEKIIDNILEKEDESINSSYNLNFYYKESTFKVGVDSDITMYACNFTEAVRLVNLISKVYRKGVEIGKEKNHE